MVEQRPYHTTQGPIRPEQPEGSLESRGLACQGPGAEAEVDERWVTPSNILTGHWLVPW
jgi:hypothetical protein